jgi:hypothetical protein
MTHLSMYVPSDFLSQNDHMEAHDLISLRCSSMLMNI